MMVQLAMTAQQQQQDGGNQDEFLRGLMTSFFLKGNDRREMRQVDIALYLQNVTSGFVDNFDWNENDFRQWCQEEARSVMESTPFPLFVESIGMALYWQGRGGAQLWKNPLDGPMSLVAWMHGSFRRTKDWTWFGYSLLSLFQQVRVTLSEAEETVRAEHPRAGPEEVQALTRRATMEALSPTLMEFVWKYNQLDIAKTLQGVCWKLLRSSKNPHRQARALVILGQEFKRQSKTHIEVCEANASSSSSFESDQARIEVALQMAQSKVRWLTDGRFVGYGIWYMVYGTCE
jgi:hypothetical protein